MTMNPLDDFLYQLNKYVEYSTELRSSFEHLTEHEKNIIRDSHPTSSDPLKITKQAYDWHDVLFEKVENEKSRS
ncbi:hypothetical protein MUO14_21820 [Halobacillus shinanisalinarum]|uniref:Uncharacterized protein n=1 Tax=Halobacillus shinanisalinarum TaxID=2932258 RepID=A0ABY4GYH5_9BACI|nr:hypothetical protein [Halobacillus shinanisalinarum]UOQ93006.1 hypothetical protein MUO14_21820 [Halobacillus shinanisalinarum]